MDTHADDYLDTLEGRNLPLSGIVSKTHRAGSCTAVSPVSSPAILIPYTRKITFGSSAFAADLSCGKYQDYTDIELVGLCTDICGDLKRSAGENISCRRLTSLVDASCCAGVTPESHENALNAMKMCQIEII